MFDKLKQIHQLQEIKKTLEKERKEMTQNGVRVVVNGKMEIEEIVLNQDLNIDVQAKTVKELINSGLKEIQMEAAKKMFDIGGR